MSSRSGDKSAEMTQEFGMTQEEYQNLSKSEKRSLAGQKGGQKGGQTVHEASVQDPQGETMQRIREGAKKGGLTRPGVTGEEDYEP